MNKAARYFWEFLLYYLIIVIIVAVVFFVISLFAGSSGYFGIAPILGIIFSATVLIDLKPHKKRVKEINQNKNKIALYFGMFQLIFGAITVPFISPISSLGVNILIVIAAAVIGYGLCYYFIRRSIVTIPKTIEILKNNMAKTKDPVKKKNLMRRLKQFD